MTSILLVRPSALGDVCRTVPVLASLRRAYPDARIDWLVRDSFIDAVRAHPALDSAIPLERIAYSKQLKRLTLNKFRRWLRDLAAPQYDMAFDCQGLFRSGFLAWASGAPRRVGLSNARELGWLWLNEALLRGLGAPRGRPHAPGHPAIRDRTHPRHAALHRPRAPCIC